MKSAQEAEKDVSAETFHPGGGLNEGDRPLQPGTDDPPLTELLAMALSEEQWEAFLRGSAIRRARWDRRDRR